RARRYHWSSDNIEDLIVEPHSGIASQGRHTGPMLNMTAKKSDQARDISVDLVHGNFGSLMKDIQLLRRYHTDLVKMSAIRAHQHEFVFAELPGKEFHYHPVVKENFSRSKYLEKILSQLSDKQPRTYEELVSTHGVGPKTVRALALVAEVIYGAKPSYQDPARYSFAHGGKDATPYPVDRPTYDQVIEILRSAVKRTRISPLEKDKALQRLGI
ncbi:MAG: DUF763 domain-containing protein, partial [Candidatus Yanofskybacteria bacterium]|nr:DUF763 domain-containing protein [Candidatus Yanofskybacteria bacterium]